MIMRSNMPVINDKEGREVPDGMSSVIDAHVHVFPHSIFSAIWKWFDKNAWKIRYQMSTIRIFDFLLSRGVKHIIALQYAHKPGIARQLNRYMSEKVAEYKNQVTGMATVFPGEPDAENILQEAFDSGLGGMKLHAHVQCFDMNANEMNCLYECCRANQKPIVMHIGREPKSSAYSCDPYELCSAEKLESILIDFPGLKVCVPHMGFDETSAYRHLIEKYDNLWLDTTMVLADYFPMEDKIDLAHYRTDRIMYGSDFPNIPYSWDKELKELNAACLSEDLIDKITNKNAIDFFSLKIDPE